MHRLLLDTPPHTNGVKAGRASSREANIDINMVIILAALLCALICAIGLNSIIRCVLRFRRRLSSEPSDQETVDHIPTKGIRKSVLHQIPVTVYGSGVKILVASCAICLSEFVEGELVKVLPNCYHGFHVRCIDTWLVSHLSCPMCRRPLLDLPVRPTVAEVE